MCVTVGQAATFFTNDSLRSTVYLYTKAERVAAACVFLALCFFKTPHPVVNGRAWYCKLFANEEELIDLCDTLIEESYPDPNLRSKIKSSYNHIVVLSGQTVCDATVKTTTAIKATSSVTSAQNVESGATQRFVISKVHITQTEFVSMREAEAAVAPTGKKKMADTVAPAGKKKKAVQLLPCPRCGTKFTKQAYDVHRMPCKNAYAQQEQKHTQIAASSKRPHIGPSRTYSSTKRQKQKSNTNNSNNSDSANTSAATTTATAAASSSVAAAM